MKFRHATLVFISGIVWLTVGIGLLQLGLRLLLEAKDGHHPIVHGLSPLFGGHESVVIVLIAASLFVGYMKGRYVLAKSAKRVVNRIVSFSNPTSLFNLYSWPYYVLIAAMMTLGILLRVLGIAPDIRGIIDVAVGSALIQGALIYFRMALALRKQTVLDVD